MINAVGKDKAESKEKAIGAYMNEFNHERMTKLAATAALEAVLGIPKAHKGTFET